MQARTVTAVLDAPREEVFRYLAEVDNLPEWATEFARELKHEDGKVKVVNGLGEFYFSIESDPDTGVIDMFAGPTEEELALFPTRVVALPGGRAAYSFTMFQGREMPDELFEAQYQALLREFDNIRDRFRVTESVRQGRPAGAVRRDDLGFLLAKATQRWNELLAERFAAAGHSDVRPSYGSVLVPLFEEDGLRMGELARRAHLSKQTMTELVRRLEGEGLVERRPDPVDGRASLIFLTARSREFEPSATAILGELDALLRERIGDARTAELRASLTDLLDLGRSP